MTQIIQRQKLDASGWPEGKPELFIDLRSERLNPDGAIVDQDGNLWNAQWGASRIACYASDGKYKKSIEFPAKHMSCPAFGGSDLSQLFATSAIFGMSKPSNDDGKTFVVKTPFKGLAENQIRLEA